MYNLNMKNSVKSEIKELVTIYKYNTILSLVIFILFLVLGYSKTNIKYSLYIDEEKVDFSKGIYCINNEQYIHIDDLIELFKDNVYNDKISGKLIITTYDNLVKIEKNDKNYVVRKNGEDYFNLNKIMAQLGNDVIVSKDKIYITGTQYIDGAIKNNRTEIYDKTSGSVLYLLQKQDKIKIIVDKNLKDDKNKTITVKAHSGEKTYYGYILKQNVEYQYMKNDNETNNKKKIILVKADNKLMTNTDLQNIDMVAINMYRLSGANSLAKLEYTNNVPETISVLATINNGQKSSNYDSDIVSAMLRSEKNRYQVIQQIEEIVKDIDGVNLDFTNFKVTDTEEYTQFIKELATVMHSNNKKITVNIQSTQYIDVESIARVVDYIILQPYLERTIYSKTSGPISSINYVEQSLVEIINRKISSDKVILEIPAHTILWTERRGTVINAELYNMKAMELYLKDNNLKIEVDNVSKQNYLNFTKGITTYKMWLEDEYSIVQKTNIAQKYNLAGVSIYKSGDEIKQIYSIINKCLNK